MTNGALLFAFNNEQIDYVKQAKECARRLIKYLDIPVALVTDTDVSDSIFTRVINYNEDSNFAKRIYSNGANTKLLTFRNTARSTAYDISPFDRTLVIDTDYMLCSDSIRSVFDTDNFLIYKNAVDINPSRDTQEFDYISEVGPKFYWATAFTFSKNTQTRKWFDLLQHIQKNYEYYVDLYKLKNPLFRNDYVFSIALDIFNIADPMPGKMYYSLDRDKPLELSESSFLCATKVDRHSIPVRLKDCDIHIMNKYWLEENL